MSSVAKLGSAVNFIRGITFKPEDVVSPNDPGAVVCMRTKNIQDELDERDLIAVPPEFVRRQELYLRPGDLLISSANSWELVGKTVYVGQLPYLATAGGFIGIVRHRGDVLHPRYLFHWMRMPETLVALRNCGRQTTNISNLSAERFLDLEIPLPRLQEQQRIATLLDKADAIRRKRREVLKLADEFLRSAFLDLFGDPVINPKGWPKDSFGNLGTLDRGKSRHRPRDEPTLYGGPHPFIQTGDVANCDGVVRRYTQAYSDLGLSQSRKWPAGTLAITIAANIGKTGILGFDACFPDSVVGFTAKPPVSAEFIQFWLGQIQNRLEETAPQSAQKNINLEILRDLPVPVPSEVLVKKFTTLVLRTRESKLRQEALLKESDLLFGSIQQRAFNGQLAAS